MANPQHFLHVVPSPFQPQSPSRNEVHVTPESTLRGHYPVMDGAFLVPLYFKTFTSPAAAKGVPVITVGFVEALRSVLKWCWTPHRAHASALPLSQGGNLCPGSRGGGSLSSYLLGSRNFESLEFGNECYESLDVSSKENRSS